MRSSDVVMVKLEKDIKLQKAFKETREILDELSKRKICPREPALVYMEGSSFRLLKFSCFDILLGENHYVHTVHVV